MGGIGIDIRVNSSQLQQARRNVEDLGRAVRDIDPSIDFTDPTASMRGSAGDMEKINAALTRMRELTRAGDSNSNLLNVRQWADMQRTMRDVTQEFRNYGKEVENSVNRVSHLTSQINQLKQKQSSGQWTNRDAHRLAGLVDERDQAEQHKKELLAREEKYTKVASRAEEYRTLMLGYGRAEEGKDGLRRTTKTASSLQNIYESGEDRGGKISAQQRKEAEGHYKRITQDVAKYRQELLSARKAVADLLKEQRAGLRGSWGHEDKLKSDERIKEARARQAEVEQHRGEYGRVQQQATNQKQQIDQFGTDHSGTANTIKKALGWGLAAAGGFSILGFLGQSRAKYQQSVGHEATLDARGIKGASGGIDKGYGPLEYMGLLENLSQSTGVSGEEAQKKAQTTALFARSQGVDLNQAAQLHSQVYQATGDNSMSNNLMIGLTSTGIQKSKMPELLQQIAKNTQVMSAAQGGAGLSQEQMLMSAMVSVEAMRKNGPDAVFAKSGEFSNFMQNGMQDAGTPAGNLIMFKAMGGFDGEMDFAKIHKMNKIKSEGFLGHMDVFDKVMAHAPKLQGEKGTEEYNRSVATRSGWMETYLQGSMKLSPKATEIMATAREQGGILHGKQFDSEEGMKKHLQALINKGGVEGKQAKELQSEIDKNPAMDKLNREARREQLHIEAGEAINRVLGSMEDAAMGIATSILNTNSAQNLISAVEQLGKTVEHSIKWITDPKKAAKEATVESAYSFGKSIWKVFGLEFGGETYYGNNKQTENSEASTQNKPSGMKDSPARKSGESVAKVPATSLPKKPAKQEFSDFWERSKRRWGFGASEAQAADSGTNTGRVRMPLPERPNTDKKTTLEPQHAGSNKIDFGTYLRGDQSAGNDPLKQKADKYAEKHGISKSLFKGLIHQESQWNTHAVSKTGAKGLGQLTMSGGHYTKGENAFDPDMNLDRSAKFLKSLLQKYKGDERKALAAYNAGSGTVDNAISKHGDDWLAHMHEFKYGKDAKAHVSKAIAHKNKYEKNEDAENEYPTMMRVEKPRKPDTGTGNAENTESHPPIFTQHHQTQKSSIQNNGEGWRRNEVELLMSLLQNALTGKCYAVAREPNN